MFSRKTVKVIHSDHRRPGCEGITQNVEVSHNHRQRWTPCPALVHLVWGVPSGVKATTKPACPVVDLLLLLTDKSICP